MTARFHSRGNSGELPRTDRAGGSCGRTAGMRAKTDPVWQHQRAAASGRQLRTIALLLALVAAMIAISIALHGTKGW